MQPATRTSSLIGAFVFVSFIVVFQIQYLSKPDYNTKSFTPPGIWTTEDLAMGNTKKGITALLSTYINQQLKLGNTLTTPSEVLITKNSTRHSVSQKHNSTHPAMKSTPKPSETTHNNTHVSDTTHNDTRHLLLAILPSRRLGNQMFEYASILGIAARNKRSPLLVIKDGTNDCTICKVCQIKHWKYKKDVTGIGSFTKSRNTATKRYDPKLESLPEDNIIYSYSYLQSWTYFKDVESEVSKIC